MKRVLALLLFYLLASLYTYTQTVNDIHLKDINVEYIQIVGTAKLLSNKVNIQIDFGQQDKLWKSSDTFIKDEKGKFLELNSMIDALNFFSKNGYEFIDAYAITVQNQNVYHYIMRKKG